MARRSDHSHNEIRRMAIEAGQNILAEEGLKGFSARKVARAIGYTVGTVYNVFGTHDDLILHINAVTLDHMRDFLMEKLNPALEGAPAIKQLTHYYVRFATEYYPLWSALFEHHLPLHTPLPPWYGEKIRALFSLIETPLLSLTEQDAQKAERSARTLWASIHGICLLGLTGKLDTVGEASMQPLLDDLIDRYFAGFSVA